MQKIAVVIPTYKDELNLLEKISLDRCRKVLSKYPLIFFAPEGKNFSYFEPTDNVVHFPPQFFQSVKTYNFLMLSPGFYETFADFEYILIYQLDAFVFYDALEYFCSLGYDYIGATFTSLSPWYRGIRKLITRVGNGGFCLRNVKACLNVLLNHPDWINQLLSLNHNEDIFFSYCGKRDDCDFRVAPVNVAYKFSADFYPTRVVKKNGGKLPFGCHAWYKQHADFYVEVFQQFDYDLRPFQNLLEHHDGGLTNFLEDIAAQRLIRRVQRGQSIVHYLPTKNFASVRVIRNPFAMMILARLIMEEPSLSDKIFLYEDDEQDILFQDLQLAKQPHLIINFRGGV